MAAEDTASKISATMKFAMLYCNTQYHIQLLFSYLEVHEGKHRPFFQIPKHKASKEIIANLSTKHLFWLSSQNQRRTKRKVTRNRLETPCVLKAV
jgi:hypothetical protein